MRRILIYCSLITVLAGCGEALMDYGVSTKTPVVESYLQEGAGTFTVKVYSMEEYLTDGGVSLSRPVTGLSLKVNGAALEETSSGVYGYDAGSDTLREGQEYSLQFEYGGKHVEASTTVPAPVRNLRAEPDYIVQSSYYFWDSSDTTEVTVSWDDPDSSYYQIYIESPGTSDLPDLGIFGRRMMQPFRGGSYRAMGREFRSAGVHWIYVYRVNRDYVELYERVSSSDLANPTSFIRNAFGIFTSMSVARVRIVVAESDE